MKSKKNEFMFCDKISDWKLISRTEKYALEAWYKILPGNSQLLEKYGLKDYEKIKTLLLKLSLNLSGDTFKREHKAFYISVIYGYYIKERYIGYYCCLFDYETAEILDDSFVLDGGIDELFI